MEKKVYLVNVQTTDFLPNSESRSCDEVFGVYICKDSALQAIKERAFLQFSFWDVLQATKDNELVFYKVSNYKSNDNILKEIITSKVYYITEMDLIE